MCLKSVRVESKGDDLDRNMQEQKELKHYLTLETKVYLEVA